MYLYVPGCEIVSEPVALPLIVPESKTLPVPPSVIVCGASSALGIEIFWPALTLAGVGS